MVREDFFAVLRPELAAPEDLARLVAELDFARALPPELDDALRVELRALLERRAPDVELARAEPVEPLSAAPPSDHLPLSTRWAASATASAIREPSLVALDIAVLAALDAASAASSPASLILRRAAGLALIAAAAAARPAASISRLIAALANLSTVLSFDPDELLEDPEDFFLLDFAIVDLPLSRGKTLQRRNGSLGNP